MTSFMGDIIFKQSLPILSVLVKGIDAKSLVKNCPEFIRTSMLTFFNNTADDLGQTIVNLQEVSHCIIDVRFFLNLLMAYRANLVIYVVPI